LGEVGLAALSPCDGLAVAVVDRPEDLPTLTQAVLGVVEAALEPICSAEVEEGAGGGMFRADAVSHTARHFQAGNRVVEAALVGVGPAKPAECVQFFIMVADLPKTLQALFETGDCIR